MSGPTSKGVGEATAQSGDRWNREQARGRVRPRADDGVGEATNTGVDGTAVLAETTDARL